MNDKRTDTHNERVVIPNAPRNLAQAGATQYTILLSWLISDNVRPDEIASHTFKVTRTENGQEQFVPAARIQPDGNGQYSHTIEVSGGSQPVKFNVQVRAQALNAEYGPFCPVLICSTAVE
ncbi:MULTISPECIES: hypothetical protein [Pseudomonas]|uniref:hypothetical protein n=1 Tax=Pseudomonas TaxID=286 RepID=UPI001BE611B8|nr:MULTISPECIES: hypothetical protein [Pseudomonas]MBT2341718.1 hypothetical protein [Pseudomonas fluorescens]MCD4532272.1 hypothetical protein [Pseudomonas sp. C3-2018]